MVVRIVIVTVVVCIIFIRLIIIIVYTLSMTIIIRILTMMFVFVMRTTLMLLRTLLMTAATCKPAVDPRLLRAPFGSRANLNLHASGPCES